MDYKIKDVVTKANIRQDIRDFYFGRIYAGVFLICCTVGIFVAFWWFSEGDIIMFGENFFSTTFIILEAILLLIGITYLIYNIYDYLQAQTSYKVMIDKYVGHYRCYRTFFHEFRSSNAHHRSVAFAANGYYHLTYGKKYYPWAQNYSMYGDEIMKIGLDEEFYVVVVNKRIVSIYNKKMFELSEEIEIMM